MFRTFLWRGYLLNANTDNGGGGGGGGGDDDDKPLKRSELIELINATVTSHTKRIKVPSKEDIAATVAEALKPTLELITTLKKPEGEGEGEGEGKGSKSKTTPETSELLKQIKTLTSQVTALTTANEETKAEAARVKREKRSQDAANALEAALGNKVIPEFKGILTRDLMRLVNIPEDDADPTMRIKFLRAKGLQEEEDELPITEAVERWLKTEEAKVYLPAPGGLRKVGQTPRTQLPGNGGRQIDTTGKNPDQLADEAFAAMGLDGVL